MTAKKRRQPVKKTAVAAPDSQITGEWGKWEVLFDWHTNLITVPTLHSAIWNARLGDTRQLYAIYRDFVLGDTHVLSEFSKRKLAVLGDTISIQPSDPKDPSAVDAADFIRENIESVANWRQACSHLLESTLYPVSVVEKVFRRDGSRFVLDRLIPVPHMLHDFRGPTGALRIRKQDEQGRPLEDFYDPPDPSRYIIHRGNLLTLPDQFGGPMRSILFWSLFAYMNREWWVRFLDRFGTPFPVGKFDEGDDGSRKILQAAFSLATRLGGLVVTKSTEVELQQADASNADAFRVFHGVACDEISKIIVGQTLSSHATSTGMGSGVAALQSAVRDDIRQYDAAMLQDTLRDQLVVQLLAVNNFSTTPPRIVWGSQSSQDMQRRISIIRDLSSASITVSDDALSTLSQDLGLGLQRSAPSAQPPAFGALSADAWRYTRRP